MEAAPAPVGVVTPSPHPDPGRQEPASWVAQPGNTSLAQPAAVPPAWPRSAQVVTALLLALAVGLLAWHAYGAQRWAARPTLLEPAAGGYVPPLDLNRADHAQLLQLPGVGESLARRIEVYRQDHDGFRDLDELRQVGGVGPAMLERLRPFVYVGVESGEEAEPAAAPARSQSPSTPAAVRKSPGKKAGEPAEPLDVNRASAEELQRLPGIGPSLSARIVAAREKKPFQSVDDLRRVPGIGPRTLEKLRPLVRVESPNQR